MKKQIDIDLLKKLYVEDKLTISDCARRLDTNRPNIRKLLLQNNIEINLKPQEINLDENTIVQKYINGTRTLDIANQYNVSHEKIVKILKHNDVNITNPRESFEITASKDELLELYRSQTITFISEKYNVSRGLIYKWMKHYEII